MVGGKLRPKVVDICNEHIENHAYSIRESRVTL